MAQPMVSVFPWSQLLPIKMATEEGTAKRRSERVLVEISRRHWLVGLHLLALVFSCFALIPLSAVASFSLTPLVLAVGTLSLAHLALIVRVEKIQKELTSLREGQEETRTVGGRVLSLRKRPR